MADDELRIFRALLRRAVQREVSRAQSQCDPDLIEALHILQRYPERVPHPSVDFIKVGYA